MRHLRHLVAIAGLLLAVPLTLAASTLVSVNAAGNGSGNGASRRPQINATGQFVVFESNASDLVGNDLNGSEPDIFVRDRVAGQTTLLSVNSAGTGSGDAASIKPRMAIFGLRVVFESDAQNLVALDKNGVRDVFARDVFGSATTLVSLNASGTNGGNGPSHDAVITPDGRYVVFLSSATDLVTGVTDTNGADDVFIRDMQTGVTKIVSLVAGGSTTGALGAFGPLSVSDDGQFVAFLSDSPLVAADGNGVSDVYVRDMAAGTTLLVSHSAATSAAGNGASFGALLVRNGSGVYFTSTATDLVSGFADGNGGADVFFWARNTGVIVPVSRQSQSPTLGNGISTTVDGGNYANQAGTVAGFRTLATDLFPSTYTRGVPNAMSYINADGAFVNLASIDPTGTAAGNGVSGGPISVSGAGDVLAFQSAATNLDPAATNGRTDIYIYRPFSGSVELVSRGLTRGGPDGDSGEAFVSEFGQFVVFSSNAENLDALDANGARDIFVQRLCTGYLVDTFLDSPPVNPGSTTCASVAGGCSLRAAVDAANASGGSLICLPAGTYNLLVDDTPMDIQSNIVLDGEGTVNTIISGFSRTQIFNVSFNAGARTSRMTERQQRGKSPKQAVEVLISNLQINDGFAANDGGAIALGPNTGLTVSLVDFDHNQALNGVGGAIAASPGSVLSILGSNFTRNNSAFQGGAVFSDGLLTIDFCRFNNNISSVDLGGARVRRSTERSGGVRPRPSESIFGDGGAVWVGDSAFAGNANTIRDTELDSNTAQAQGGAVYIENGAKLDLTNVTLAFNDADVGGGLYNEGAVTLTNATISQNKRFGGPGVGIGNGIVGQARVTNATIVGNSSGGTGHEIDSTGARLQIANSIVFGDPAVNCTGTVLTLGHNIENGTTCGFTGTGDKSSTDPKVDPNLQYNGGFEQTHGLLLGSPAVDAADDALSPPTDERNVPRPQGAHADVGAVESIGVTISDVRALEGDSGTTAFAFTVSLSVPAINTVTVAFATADGTALTEDNDYVATSGVLSFGFQEQFKTITVTVNGDTKQEPNETFFVNLSNPTGGVGISKGQGVGTILNDDGGATLLGPTPYLSKADSPFLADINAGRAYLETFECGTLGVPGVTASAGVVIGPSGITDSVDADDGLIDGFGQGGHSFFSGNGPGGITFQFDARVLGSLPTEAGIVWTDGAGTTTFEAFDSEGISLGQVGPVSIADGSISGTTGEDRFFGVRFSGGISAIKISNSSGGIEVDHLQYGPYTITGGADLLIAGAFSPNPVQPGGSLTLTLQPANAGPLAACQVTVTDTLPAGVTFLSASGSGWSCSSQTVGVIQCTTASLPAGPAAPITIQLTAPQATGLLTNVATIASQTPDPQISNNTGSATVVVGTGLPVLSIGSLTIPKPPSGTVTAVFPVTLSAPSRDPVRVFFSTLDGTARTPGDYLESRSSLYFEPGSTASSISVIVKGNTIASDDKFFNVQLYGATGATLGVGLGMGTIQDHSPLPVLSIGDIDVTVGSTDAVTAVFTISLSPPTGRTVSVHFQTADDTAKVGDQDYLASGGTLAFQPGETSKTIAVTVLPRGFLAARSFFLDLSAPVNATLLRSRGIATITRGYPALAAGDGVVRAPGSGGDPKSAVLTVNLSPPSQETVTVAYATADRTAVAGEDYVAATGTLTFDPGETSQDVTVSILPRGAEGPTKVFALTLSSPSNAIVSKRLGDCAIFDNSRTLPPGPFVFLDDLSVARPGSSFATTVRITVRLTGPSDVPFNIPFTTKDGTAHAGTDYLATAGTLFIPAGETRRSILVPVLRVPGSPGNRTFVLSLTDPFHGDLVPAAEAKITITGP